MQLGFLRAQEEILFYKMHLTSLCVKKKLLTSLYSFHLSLKAEDIIMSFTI